MYRLFSRHTELDVSRMNVFRLRFWYQINTKEILDASINGRSSLSYLKGSIGISSSTAPPTLIAAYFISIL